MVNNLDSKIEGRKKQAERKKIEEKADLVAKTLGKVRILEGNEEGYISCYQGNNLKIDSRFIIAHAHDGDSLAFGTEVIYRGKGVYHSGGGTLYSYIPGSWERTLNRLYSEAKPLAEEKETRKQEEIKAEQKKKENEVRSRWGL